MEQLNNFTLKKMQMRKIISALLLLLSINSKAQIIENWKEVTNDSETFVTQYGSVGEYNYQHNYLHSNRNIYKMHFIDTRPYWITEISKWLVGSLGCNKQVETNFDYDRNCLDEDLSACGEDIEPIKIKAYYSPKNFRTTKVIITGNPKAIISLFIGYWEDPIIKVDLLRKGHKVYMMSGDDRVTFTWPSKTAQITIDKNPDFTFFRKKFPMTK